MNRKCIKCEKIFDEDEDYVYAKDGRLCMDCMEDMRKQFMDMFGIWLENNDRFCFEIDIGNMLDFLSIIKKEYTQMRYIINFIDINNLRNKKIDKD